jgi:hypothetical protein
MRAGNRQSTPFNSLQIFCTLLIIASLLLYTRIDLQLLQVCARAEIPADNHILSSQAQPASLAFTANTASGFKILAAGKNSHPYQYRCALISPGKSGLACGIRLVALSLLSAISSHYALLLSFTAPGRAPPSFC